MNIVLLSGGSGKRLWPLSNEIRSKQFIKILRNNNEYESMVQRVYRQIKKVDKDAYITIATAQNQISAIKNQLGDKVRLSIEPCRRDTFPAILLASVYLHYECKKALDDVVVVCPVDPYVEDSYFEALKQLEVLAKNGESNIALMGIEPTYPSEKYGYIIPENKNNVSRVRSFKEKPNEKVASEYIKQGALWNGGVFAYKIGYLLNKAHRMVEFSDYNDLRTKYELLEKISFDYAIVEKESSIQVMRYWGKWMDLGTWNTLTEVMTDTTFGNVIKNDTNKDVHIINELDIPILCVGLKNAVVSASPEGILVSEKEASPTIKQYVDEIDGQIMFAEKSWGDYKVLSVDETSITTCVILKEGHHMQYHSHMNRKEIWTVVEGDGVVIIDEEKKLVKKGDVIEIPVGCKHTAIAKTMMKMVEIQIGSEISYLDKKTYEFPSFMICCERQK